MAANLAGRGLSLSVHNRTRVRGELRCWLPVRRRAQPAGQLAAAADWLWPMPHRWAAAEAVCFSGCRPAAAVWMAPQGPRGSTFSTESIRPSALAGRAPGRQGVALSKRCPGDVHGRAKAGSLSVSSGRNGMADLERARPLLEVVGSRITHLGRWACGQAGQGGHQCWWPAATPPWPRRWPWASGWGCRCGGLSGPSPAGRAGSWALEKPGWRMLEGSFPLVSSWRCTARPAIRLAAQPPRGWTVRSRERFGGDRRRP